jgi:hypothetical protein
MLASKLRPVSRRVGILSSSRVDVRSILPAVAGTASSSPSKTIIGSSSFGVRLISTEQEKHFQELGIIDDQGLTVFDTLHEMQVNSCKVFSQNELFGTYIEESESFQFMTYDEYSQEVDRCRVLLKDLGKSQIDEKIQTGFFCVVIEHLFSWVLLRDFLVI